MYFFPCLVSKETVKEVDGPRWFYLPIHYSGRALMEANVGALVSERMTLLVNVQRVHLVSKIVTHRVIGRLQYTVEQAHG